MPAAADSAPLVTALGTYHALEVSVRELANERDAAKDAASKAAEIVRIRAKDCIAHRLVSELLAARNIYWKLEEVLPGFFLLDEHRHAI